MADTAPSSSSQNNVFPFLRLPLELRNEIYRHTLQANSRTWRLRGLDEHHSMKVMVAAEHFPLVSLMLVNKHLLSEYLEEAIWYMKLHLFSGYRTGSLHFHTTRYLEPEATFSMVRVRRAVVHFTPSLTSPNSCKEHGSGCFCCILTASFSRGSVTDPFVDAFPDINRILVFLPSLTELAMRLELNSDHRMQLLRKYIDPGMWHGLKPATTKPLSSLVHCIEYRTWQWESSVDLLHHDNHRQFWSQLNSSSHNWIVAEAVPDSDAWLGLKFLDITSVGDGWETAVQRTLEHFRSMYPFQGGVPEEMATRYDIYYKKGPMRSVDTLRLV